MKNQNTTTENFRNDFVARQFEVDASDATLNGFAFIGDYWNGWGCPYFDFDTMHQLASIYSDGEYWNIKFEPDTDEFHFEDLLSDDGENGGNYIYKIGATVINGMKLYQAHQLCWCFHELEMDFDRDEQYLESVNEQTENVTSTFRFIGCEQWAYSVTAPSKDEALKLLEAEPYKFRENFEQFFVVADADCN